ncbi:MAG: hypothetical protein R2827_14770 [Bdellovibrionales bacterium]
MFLLVFLIASQALAVETTVQIPVFATWKQQQIIRSQNEVVRLTNELLMSKSTDHQILNTWEETINPSEGVVRQDQVGEALKQARQNLEISKELEFDDYLEIHMEALMADKEALRVWLSRLSQSEVVDAFHYLAERGDSSLIPPIDVGAAAPSKAETLKAN